MRFWMSQLGWKLPLLETTLLWGRAAPDEGNESQQSLEEARAWKEEKHFRENEKSAQLLLDFFTSQRSPQGSREENFIV